MVLLLRLPCTRRAWALKGLTAIDSAYWFHGDLASVASWVRGELSVKAGMDHAAMKGQHAADALPGARAVAAVHAYTAACRPDSAVAPSNLKTPSHGMVSGLPVVLNWTE